MPPMIVSKGKIAMQRLAFEIKDQVTLNEKIDKLSPGANPMSCALTSSVVASAVSKKNFVAIQNVNATSPVMLVRLISEKLSEANMIYINMIPDHHFIIVPIDIDKVIILQSFQDVYNFTEWTERRGKGIYRKDEFLRGLGDLLGPSETAKRRAAIDLFSYNLSDPKDKQPGAAKVKSDIHDYYNGKDTKIVSMGYKAL